MNVAAPLALGVSVLATPALAAMPSFFPEVEISKQEAKTEWPFSVGRGELSCVSFGEGAFVFFSEILNEREESDGKLSRMVVVTANPLALFASFEDRALYAPFDSLETLITRLAPYETMGRALCAQQKKN